jgi:phage pi2 protein 07
MATDIVSTNNRNQSIDQYFYDPSKESYSQMLSVNLNIPIPADSVLISKVQLEELKKAQLRGAYWSMKDLQLRTNKKAEWIKENILYPTRFRKILDAANGGFVFYPKSEKRRDGSRPVKK